LKEVAVEMKNVGFVLNTNQMEWEDPPRGYYLTDVKQKVLWDDEKTGAKMIMLKFPVGVSDKPHIHPKANQYAYFLEGESKGPDGNLLPVNGWFIYTPKGMKHGGSTITKEILLIQFWDGPLDPEF
jgi:hypothetical protein